MKAALTASAWFAIPFVTLALACNKPKEPPSSTGVAQAIASQNTGQPPSPPQLQAHPPQAAASSDVKLTWKDPPGWKKLAPRSAMRKASYEIPAASGDSEAGELAVFYFGPSEGGGVEANVQRWIGQFKDFESSTVQRSERSVNGLTQHVVEIPMGTYTPGMGQPGSKQSFGLVGAVVESPSGSYFFKLTGPKATVAAARKPFFDMLDSMQPVS